jgi:hypothetical protein
MLRIAGKRIPVKLPRDSTVVLRLKRAISYFLSPENSGGSRGWGGGSTTGFTKLDLKLAKESRSRPEVSTYEDILLACNGIQGVVCKTWGTGTGIIRVVSKI